MSIILKGNNINGEKQGFPSNNLSDVNIILDHPREVYFSLTYPYDYIVDGVILSTIDSIITVVKKKSDGEPPKNVNDGDAKIWKFSNTNGGDHISLSPGHTIEQDVEYWVRFFTISKDGIINSDPTQIYSFMQPKVDKILANNSWETINKVAEAGKGQDYWNIGDEITIELNGNYGPNGENISESVVLQIWDFNHFDKSDGSGKANIVFGCKNLLNNTYQMNSSNTNKGGWESCKMRNNVMQNIYSSMPSSLKQSIKQVNTVTTKGDTSPALQTSKDYVFIPNYLEVGFTGYESEGYKFPIFSNDTSRRKKINGSVDFWWLRSPYHAGIYDFCYVYYDGSDYGYWSAVDSHGVAFCFNV